MVNTNIEHVCKNCNYLAMDICTLHKIEVSPEEASHCYCELYDRD